MKTKTLRRVEFQKFIKGHPRYHKSWTNSAKRIRLVTRKTTTIVRKEKKS